MENNKNIRIRTDINSDDKHITLKLERDFENLEILSLKLTQSEVYKNFRSDYGVVIGRVIGNGGTGIPNAKVSIFIPIDEEDSNNPDILAYYNFTSVNDTDTNGKRYNLLPVKRVLNKFSGWVENLFGLGYQPLTPVGTMPIKEQVLCDNTLLQIYKKYYKFSTVTNNSGDFMIYGVPVGTHTLHMDCDLTDIGKFSVKPALLPNVLGLSRDLLNEDGTKIREDINELERLPNIQTQNISIDVIPFWSNVEDDEIGITRQDFNIKANIVPSFTVFGAGFTMAKDAWWGDTIFFRLTIVWVKKFLQITTQPLNLGLGYIGLIGKIGGDDSILSNTLLNPVNSVIEFINKYVIGFGYVNNNNTVSFSLGFSDATSLSNYLANTNHVTYFCNNVVPTMTDTNKYVNYSYVDNNSNSVTISTKGYCNISYKSITINTPQTFPGNVEFVVELPSTLGINGLIATLNNFPIPSIKFCFPIKFFSEGPSDDYSQINGGAFDDSPFSIKFKSFQFDGTNCNRDDAEDAILADNVDDSTNKLDLSTHRNLPFKNTFYSLDTDLAKNFDYNAIDVDTDIFKVNNKNHILFQEDGVFAAAILCNYKKVVTLEDGTEVEVDNDDNRGIFTQFRGYMISKLEGEVQDPPLQRQTSRVFHKVPQYDTYLATDQVNFYDKNWVSQYYTFEAGKIYTISQLYGYQTGTHQEDATNIASKNFFMNNRNSDTVGFSAETGESTNSTTGDDGENNTVFTDNKSKVSRPDIIIKQDLFEQPGIILDSQSEELRDNLVTLNGQNSGTGATNLNNVYQPFQDWENNKNWSNNTDIKSIGDKPYFHQIWVNGSLYFPNFMFKLKRRAEQKQSKGRNNNKYSRFLISWLQFDDDQYALGGGDYGIRGLSNGANFKTTFVELKKEDFVKIFSTGSPNYNFNANNPVLINDFTNYNSVVFSNYNTSINNKLIKSEDDTVYIYKGLKGVDCFRYVYEKNLL